MSVGTPGADSKAAEAPLPLYTRKATGLVREVSLVDHLVFNFTSATALVSGLAVTTFVVAVFPLANYTVALVLALVLSVGLWVTVSLMTATMPKIGGDYVFNSRILHPALGFAANLCVVGISPLTAGLVAGFIATLGLNPALTAIGTVTGNQTVLGWAPFYASPTGIMVCGTIGVLLVTVLAALGTRILIRTMTILIAIFTVGMLIDLAILLFTSNASFIDTYNHLAGSGAYQKVVAAGAGKGLYPSESGYSFKSTMGALFYAITIIAYCFWGVYLVAEVRRAGQRNRMLQSFLGGGFLQSISLIIGWVLLVNTVGENFFISATAGNITTGIASFPFFVALVAGSPFLVTVLSIAFMLWIIPGININMAVVQRGVFTYAFEGLLPKSVAAVNPRTHTPIVAIVIVAILSELGVILYAYWAGLVTIVTIIGYFPFVALFLLGISAIIFRRRRPDIYNGSPADWHPFGLPVLEIGGVFTCILSALSIFLVFYFSQQTGLAVNLFWAAVGPALVVVGGIIWWYIARAVRQRQGVNLDLLYQTIPPD